MSYSCYKFNTFLLLEEEWVLLDMSYIKGSYFVIKSLTEQKWQ